MRVSTDRAEIHYTTRGTGTPCIVLSAIGTAPYEEQLAPALANHFTLVFVDLRGGGTSTGDARELTLEQLGRDLEAVRHHLNIDRVAVLGHSILGALAIEYGRRCSSAVSHVIAVGTPPTGNMDDLVRAAAAFFERDASADRKRVLADNLAQLPANASFSQRFLAQAPARFFDARVDMTPLYASAISRPDLLGHLTTSLLATWNAATAIASLHAPLLLAHGRYDYTVPHVMWDDMKDRFPNVSWRLFERSGHQPFLEEPAEFASVVTAWFAGL